MLVEIFSFSFASILFLILGLILLTGRQENKQKKMLAFASLASSVWAGSVVYQSIYGGLLNATLILELFRSLAWFAFLLVILRTAYTQSQRISKQFRITFTGMTIFVVGLMLLAAYRISGGSMFEFIAGNDVLVGHMMISLGGLVMIEQLYRNTSEEHRWAMKYLWLAIGSMFAYDFYLYSDALLFQRIDNELWNARGFIHAMVVPLIGVAIKREMQWSLGNEAIDVFVSRKIIVHTTTLLGAGIYMMVIGVGGYYVRKHGGNWGEVAQAAFMFASILVLAVLIFSSRVRAKLKVLIDKHFFHYKYDYRDEWLRIIKTLSSGDRSMRPHESAIRALAQIIDSPGGALWMRRNNYFEPEASLNMIPPMSKEASNTNFIRFLEQQQFVISVGEFSTNPQLYTRLAPLDIPEWMNEIKHAWLIVPLILKDSLLGFVVLEKSPSSEKYFNWEDSDLLKTAGKQAASYLAQYEVAQELAGARRFEEVNKLSAFVVHDLKNMIGQLSLIVSNANKHKHNPLFLEDAVSTVENSVQKMNKLLARLKGTEKENNQSCNLFDLLEEVVRERSRTGMLPIPVLNCQSDNVEVVVDKDRLMANLDHIVQNAQDATEEDGRITVRLRLRREFAVVEVEDTGCGMNEEFISEKLFQPFESTKGSMGIGVFQVREFIYKLGGELEVESKVNEGTIFRLYIPVASKSNVIEHPSLKNVNKSKSI